MLRVPSFPSAVLIVSLTLSAASQLAHAQGSTQLEQLSADAQRAKSHGDVEGSIAAYKHMIAVAPNSAAAHNNLGLLFFNADRFSDALPELLRAHKLQPASIPTEALLGMTYVALHRDAEAIPLLEHAVRGNDRDPQVETALIDLLMTRGEYFAAAEHLRHESQYAPSPEIDYREQLCYVALAQQASSHLVHIAPDSYFAHALRGQALAERGDYRAALPELAYALTLGPQERGAHLHLADAYWNVADWRKAEGEFEEELKLDPESCYANWKLANTRMQLKEESAQILPLLEKAVERCPTLNQARMDRGITYLDSGRTQEALADLTQANQNDPEEPSIHFQLSKVYKALHRPEDASREMKRFVELDQKTHVPQP